MTSVLPRHPRLMWLRARLPQAWPTWAIALFCLVAAIFLAVGAGLALRLLSTPDNQKSNSPVSNPSADIGRTSGFGDNTTQPTPNRPAGTGYPKPTTSPKTTTSLSPSGSVSVTVTVTTAVPVTTPSSTPTKSAGPVVTTTTPTDTDSPDPVVTTTSPATEAPANPGNGNDRGDQGAGGNDGTSIS